MIFGAICAVWVARAPLLWGAAALWVVSDPLSPADAVVVLGGRTDLRPIAAAAIYRRGLAKQVLVAGPEPNLDERRAGSSDRDVLRTLGVPSFAIIPFGPDVTSTVDEARALARWASASKPRRVIIPTDLFHTRRVKHLFSRALRPAGAVVDVVALTPPAYKLADWWRHEEGLVAFKNELVKHLFYRLTARPAD